MSNLLQLKIKFAMELSSVIPKIPSTLIQQINQIFLDVQEEIEYCCQIRSKTN